MPQGKQGFDLSFNASSQQARDDFQPDAKFLKL